MRRKPTYNLHKVHSEVVDNFRLVKSELKDLKNKIKKEKKVEERKQDNKDFVNNTKEKNYYQWVQCDVREETSDLLKKYVGNGENQWGRSFRKI